MNKLIDTFKQNAGIDFNPDQEGLDQFAELIVKEAARIADMYSAMRVPTSLIGPMIRKHFGVD